MAELLPRQMFAEELVLQKTTCTCSCSASPHPETFSCAEVTLCSCPQTGLLGLMQGRGGERGHQGCVQSILNESFINSICPSVRLHSRNTFSLCFSFILSSTVFLQEAFLLPLEATCKSQEVCRSWVQNKNKKTKKRVPCQRKLRMPSFSWGG